MGIPLFNKIAGIVEDVFSKLMEVSRVLGPAMDVITRVVKVAMSKNDTAQMQEVIDKLKELEASIYQTGDSIQRVRLELAAAIDPEGPGGDDITLGEGIEVSKELARLPQDLAAIVVAIKQTANELEDLV